MGCWNDHQKQIIQLLQNLSYGVEWSDPRNSISYIDQNVWPDVNMPRYQDDYSKADDQDFEKRSVENLNKLLKRAQYDEMAISQILEEYHSFKSSVRALSNSSKDENDFIRLFEFALFKQHECKEYVYRRTPRISPWAYTLVAVFWGAYTRVWAYTMGGLYTVVKKRKKFHLT